MEPHLGRRCSLQLHHLPDSSIKFHPSTPSRSLKDKGKDPEKSAFSGEQGQRQVSEGETERRRCEDQESASSSATCACLAFV